MCRTSLGWRFSQKQGRAVLLLQNADCAVLHNFQSTHVYVGACGQNAIFSAYNSATMPLTKCYCNMLCSIHVQTFRYIGTYTYVCLYFLLSLIMQLRWYNYAWPYMVMCVFIHFVLIVCIMYVTVFSPGCFSVWGRYPLHADSVSADTPLSLAKGVYQFTAHAHIAHTQTRVVNDGQLSFALNHSWSTVKDSKNWRRLRWKTDFPWKQVTDGDGGMLCTLCRKHSRRPKKVVVGRAGWIDIRTLPHNHAPGVCKAWPKREPRLSNEARGLVTRRLQHRDGVPVTVISRKESAYWGIFLTREKLPTPLTSFHCVS